MSNNVDLIVTNAAVYTCDPAKEWAEAFAVTAGLVTAVGTSAEIEALAAADTKVLDAHGRMVLPGLCDVHSHLMFGGAQAAWELTLLPSDGLDTILAKVRKRAERLAPDEWVVGGIIGSPVLDQIALGGKLPALDEASGGRPVLLRDDSHHNRWVNSRALELMGVDQNTPNPDGGTYVRDSDGKLTGVLYEAACALAEDKAAAAIKDHRGRDRVSLATAVRLVNSYGITAVQDAGTLENALLALSDLDNSSELTAWVVGSLPARPFFGEGTVGEELYAVAEKYRTKHVRPDFVKVFLDGVPMTRTSAMLTPYLCHGEHEDPTDTGELLWTRDDLVATLERCIALGLGAKLHATGDGSVRQALDAIEVIRKIHGDGPIFQIAHVAYVDPADRARFAQLNVVPDLSPYIWYPNIFGESIANQIPETVLSESWPIKDLAQSGALVSGGSDWPVVPVPSPWLGMETLVTRANPDPAVPGDLNVEQAISLAEAIATFTRNPATAMGLGDTTGAITAGRSADFVLLNHNLFEIPTNDIHKTEVIRTYFQGKNVYEGTEKT